MKHLTTDVQSVVTWKFREKFKNFFLYSLSAGLCSATYWMFALSTQWGRVALKSDKAVWNWRCIVCQWARRTFFLKKWIFMLCETHFGQTIGRFIVEGSLYVFIYSLLVFMSSSQVHDPCWQFLVLSESAFTVSWWRRWHVFNRWRHVGVFPTC